MYFSDHFEIVVGTEDDWFDPILNTDTKLFIDPFLIWHGLVMSGEPRVPGYRVVDWTWEAKRVRSSVR